MKNQNNRNKALRKRIEQILNNSDAHLSDQGDKIIEEILHEVNFYLTEKKNAEEKLRQSQETYLGIINSVSESIYVQDEHGVFLDVNDASIKSYGIKRSDLIGKTPKILSAGKINDLELVAEMHKKAFNGEPQRIYFWGKKADGSVFPKEVMLTNGTYFGRKVVIAVSRDITERKQAEEKLLESESKYRLLFESNPQPMLVYDIESLAILAVNSTMIKKYGYSEEEFLSMTIKDITPEEDIERLFENIKWVDEGLDEAGEWKHRLKDGTIIDVDINSYFINYQGRKAEIVLATDITERNRAEEALRESEERFRSLYENATVGIYRTSFDGEIIMANPTLVEMLGYDSFDDLKTRNLKDDGYEPDYPREEFQRLIAEQGEIYAFEARWKVKDGSTIYVSESARLICDEQGKPLFYEGIVEDITRRKLSAMVMQARIRLMEYSEKHTLPELLRETLREAEMLTNSQIGFYHFIDEEKGEILLNQWSESTEKELRKLPKGFDKSYPIARDGIWVDCVHQRKPVIQNNYQELTNKKGHSRGHFKVVRELAVPVFRNKKIVAVLEIGNKSTNYNNDEVEIISQLADLAWDIAGKKMAEEQLHKLSKGIEQSPVVVMITDTEGTIEYINSRFTEVTGYSPEEVIGQNPRILKSGRHDTSFYHELWETIKSGNDWIGEILNRKKSGETYWESALISPIKDEKGEIRNFIALKEDVTERKKADEAIRQNELILKNKNEEYMTLNKELVESNDRIKKINKELIAAREKAEESDKLKTAFLANLSHEIRTPMNSIIGISDIILRSNITKEKQELFQILNTSCHQLLTVVNDMIDISRIETGQMDIHIGKTNINQAITHVRNIFIPQVVQQDVVVESSFQLRKELAEFNTDEVKLNQILTNLLSNAIKFTEQGTIEIGYNVVDNFIEFYVSDTGIGIKPEHHEIIFERFRQVEVEYTRKYGGTGLGLSICKAFVEMLGGRIWVVSEFGKGATFHFTLPYDNQILSRQKVEDDKQIDFDLSDKIALVAEDEQTNYLVLNEFLKDAGVKVIHARDGIEAIDIFLDNTNIDIVLMDIKMPRMNGIEATQAIKAINNKIPVIAITAYALAGDREKFLTAGCDDYISKPIMQTELLEKIQKIIRK